MKKISKKVISLSLVLIIGSLLMTACANGSKTGEDNGKYNVVATTTFIADLTKQIAGDYVNVKGLMGPGIDPHSYKASAGDVGIITSADMVLYNGLFLEGKLSAIFDNLKGGDKIVYAVTQDIDESKFLEFESNPGSHDPHIWFDVNLWKEAAKTLASQLKVLDSDNSEAYDSNLESYLEELDELGSYIRKRIEELPEERRVLITAHDAFGYMGNAYGIEVKGLQGISTSSEAGTADVRELANYIVENEIKAIFMESSVPVKSTEALKEAVIAQGFNVEIGGELYSDSTGSAGTEAETYIGTYKSNIDTIVNALK